MKPKGKFPSQSGKEEQGTDLLDLDFSDEKNEVFYWSSMYPEQLEYDKVLPQLVLDVLLTTVQHYTIKKFDNYYTFERLAKNGPRVYYGKFSKEFFIDNFYALPWSVLYQYVLDSPESDEILKKYNPEKWKRTPKYEPVYTKPLIPFEIKAELAEFNSDGIIKGKPSQIAHPAVLETKIEIEEQPEMPQGTSINGDPEQKKPSNWLLLYLAGKHESLKNKYFAKSDDESEIPLLSDDELIDPVILPAVPAPVHLAPANPLPAPVHLAPAPGKPSCCNLFSNLLTRLLVLLTLTIGKTVVVLMKFAILIMQVFLIVFTWLASVKFPAFLVAPFMVPPLAPLPPALAPGYSLNQNSTKFRVYFPNNPEFALYQYLLLFIWFIISTTMSCFMAFVALLFYVIQIANGDYNLLIYLILFLLNLAFCALLAVIMYKLYYYNKSIYYGRSTNFLGLPNFLVISQRGALEIELDRNNTMAMNGYSNLPHDNVVHDPIENRWFILSDLRIAGSSFYQGVRSIYNGERFQDVPLRYNHKIFLMTMTTRTVYVTDDAVELAQIMNKLAANIKPVGVDIEVFDTVYDPRHVAQYAAYLLTYSRIQNTTRTLGSLFLKSPATGL